MGRSTWNHAKLIIGDVLSVSKPSWLFGIEGDSVDFRLFVLVPRLKSTFSHTAEVEQEEWP